ncbi:LytTR family transcriptional regulator DNA-binding domain-containing protein [Cohnella cellulosilytica]|uniref:LytTR family transcriptional regulator DNA-binding domain-containing protein n=1 Tax=Cohnella cellulosilytica TaxID=986710 RepID=UPI00361F1E55
MNVAPGQSVAIYSAYETAEMLMGLLQGLHNASGGEIRFEDRVADKGIMERFVFALNGEKVNQRLKVSEYLKFWSRLFGSRIEIAQVASLVGLTGKADSLIAKLTASEQIRLQWARCILQDQALAVFIDQSMQVMDHESLAILQAVIAFLKRENKAVLVVAASAEQAADLGDQTYRLFKGELLPLQQDADKAGSDSVRRMIEISKVPVKLDDKIRLLNPFEINYIEGRDGNAIVYVDSLSYICAMTLNQLETRLTPFGFFRSHRSYLVNLQQVREIETWTKDSYILKLDGVQGSTVPLSKSKYLELKEQLDI